MSRHHIDWDAMTADTRPVIDLRVDEMFVSRHHDFARWRAGAEMTNYSGCAAKVGGYWLVQLDLGETYRTYSLAPMDRHDNVVVTRWNGDIHPGSWSPNTRTVLALQQILSQAALVKDMLGA